MQINSNKNIRSRRDISSNEDSFKEIINDFKKARDALYEEYEWKRYNLSEIWSKWDQAKNSKINSTINNSTANLTTDFICEPKNCEPKNCTMHVGVTASIFGALILLTVAFLKLIKKF